MKYLVKCIKHQHGDVDWQDIVAETTSEEAAEWLVYYYMKKRNHEVMLNQIHYTYDRVMEDSDILQLWLEEQRRECKSVKDYVNINDVKIEI